MFYGIRFLFWWRERNKAEKICKKLFKACKPVQRANGKSKNVVERIPSNCRGELKELITVFDFICKLLELPYNLAGDNLEFAAEANNPCKERRTYRHGNRNYEIVVSRFADGYVRAGLVVNIVEHVFRKNNLLPALEMDNELISLLSRAHNRLGRLDARSSFLPDNELLLGAYIRKEALFSR